jgi:general secretion pathway protein B
MSFILDALKKSESDRQRKNGPALFEVKVAPPRTHLPAWAIAIAALLVVNLAIVMWMVMRHPARAGAGAESSTAPAAAAPTPATQGAAPLTALASASGAAATLSAAAASASPAQPRAPAAAPPGPAPTPAASADAAPAPPSSSQPSQPSVAADGTNPDDYAPAEEAPAASQPSGLFSGRVRRGTAAGVPLYQDAAATPGTQIPQLRLDLHVFAARPQDRFVMINMHKVHEGDTLPEGVHVDNITPEGAVLSYNGSRFLLPRE